MTRFVYLTHIVPLEPGPEGRTSGILTSMGAEGWRVVSATPVPVRPSLMAPDQQQLGLFVVLEKSTELAPEPAPLPGGVPVATPGGQEFVSFVSSCR